MDLTTQFIDGAWSHSINVTDFVRKNLTPYEGDGFYPASRPAVLNNEVTGDSEKGGAR